MAKLGQDFDPQAHDTDAQPDYSELPNGDYLLEIEVSDVGPNSSGTGTILKTTFQVIEPEEFKGRKLFGNYNLEHNNPKAQEIGQRQFAQLCRAIGHTERVDDSEELHFRAFMAKVGLGKPSKDGQYPARAEIKKYYYPDEGNLPNPAIDDNQPAPPANDNRAAAKPAARPAAAAAAGTKRPWGK
ncbi:DUF669 domain-containing protein [Pseudohoeflea suaedae]|uniref:DUF669 domain-containing protein n=1 Tax=Pseudohoeflea suaedae TaxID=877384 RepID=A0A4R5PJ69_9HYPH|nr:DUF669 domain-containing protein [Pseudohoeflea suaedae]TDH35690.1 DUF669 domain-containing protein [Pseudohoeflea suaedae]